MKASKILYLWLIICTLALPQSCGRSEQTVSCFPNSAVNVVLNLNLPAYYKLQTVGGWLYINEQGSGTRGLIVVRTATGFQIYDRNAPHICPDTNTTLEVREDIKVFCPKDEATWILLTGEPTNISKVPPKTYGYTYNAGSNTLSIYN